MKAILKMSPEEQRAMANSLKGDKRDEFLEGMNPQQRETLMALNNPQQVVAERTGARQIAARHLQRTPACRK